LKVGSTESDFLESIHNAFLHQAVDAPTRYRIGQRANILDLILASDKDMVRDLQVNEPLDSSNHCILTFNITFNTTKHTTYTDRLLYDKGDYSIFAEMIQTDWQELLNPLDVEEAWGLFTSKLLQAEAKRIPKRRPNKNHKPQWLGKEQRENPSKTQGMEKSHDYQTEK
jgi:hypothetical protein